MMKRCCKGCCCHKEEGEKKRLKGKISLLHPNLSPIASIFGLSEMDIEFEEKDGVYVSRNSISWKITSQLNEYCKLHSVIIGGFILDFGYDDVHVGKTMTKSEVRVGDTYTLPKGQVCFSRN